MVAATLASSGSPVRPDAADVPPQPAPTRTPEHEALAAARATGQRVEVTGKRTDRVTLYAEPDGTFLRE
jgi:hypothetical protein